MSDLLPLEDALARMMARVNALPFKRKPLLQCDGCVLGHDCIAQLTKPPFAVSAMDGYALPQAPSPGSTFDVVGEVPAGGRYSQPLRSGETVRIFTGAPVPNGTSHVLIQEDAVRDADQLTVGPEAGTAQNIRPAGGDFSKGDVLITAGTLLTPQDLGLAASANHSELTIHPKPSIAIMMNGDELSWPGGTLTDSSIIASNGYALATLAKRMGAELADLTLIEDDQSEIERYIAGSTADILVTIGGASVGDYDLIRPALEAIGYTLDFPKVALRPGKPTLFGHNGDKTVLGLPGNPVSSFVSAMIFLRPLITKLAAKDPTPLLPLETAALGADLTPNGPRAHLMRARQIKAGTFTPITSQDSSLLRLLSSSDALIYRPINDAQRAAGSQIEILRLPT